MHDRDQLYCTPRGMKRLSVRSQVKDDDIMLVTSQRHSTPRNQQELMALKEKEISVLKSVNKKLISTGERVRNFTTEIFYTLFDCFTVQN